jgi:hypothetical protein
MLFTDPTFLFLFLPVLLGLCFLPFSWHRNGLLLSASILFHASGGYAFSWLMLASIAFNYAVAVRIRRASGTPPRRSGRGPEGTPGGRHPRDRGAPPGEDRALRVRRGAAGCG